MTYDYSKLKGRIAEVYGTRGKFADAMGMSEHTMSCKLNNKKSWRQDEIQKAASLLGLNVADIYKFFFTRCVQIF